MIIPSDLAEQFRQLASDIVMYSHDPEYDRAPKVTEHELETLRRAAYDAQRVVDEIRRRRM